MSEHIPLFVEMSECKHLSLIDIAVYGAVYFYSFRGKSLFSRSYKTTGEKLSITKNTVKKSIKHLVDLGIIEDTTPDKLGATHEYKLLWIPEFGTVKLIERANELYQQMVQGIPANGTVKAQTVPANGTNKNKTNNTKNGNGKKLPPQNKPKPLTMLSDSFTSVSGIKIPTRKTDVKFWWSSIREIYNVAEKDEEVAKKLIEYTIKKMVEEKLTISDPNSIVKTARSVMAQRASQKLKTTVSSTATVSPNGGAFI